MNILLLYGALVYYGIATGAAYGGVFGLLVAVAAHAFGVKALNN